MESLVYALFTLWYVFTSVLDMDKISLVSEIAAFNQEIGEPQ